MQEQRQDQKGNILPKGRLKFYIHSRQITPCEDRTQEEKISSRWKQSGNFGVQKETRVQLTTLLYSLFSCVSFPLCVFCVLLPPFFTSHIFCIWLSSPVNCYTSCVFTSSCCWISSKLPAAPFCFPLKWEITVPYAFVICLSDGKYGRQNHL